MERISYQKTQPGTALILVLLVALGIEVSVLFEIGRTPAPADSRDATVDAVVVGSSIVLTAACATLFSTMTVAVSDAALEWWFAFGLLRQRVALDRIAGARVKRASLLAAPGIHTDGRNWTWIVNGRDVVVCDLRDGRRVALGSPEPARLVAIINARLGRAGYSGA